MKSFVVWIKLMIAKKYDFLNVYTIVYIHVLHVRPSYGIW